MRTGELVARRYRLKEARGSGSGGTVWTAFDTKLRRLVALKRPHGVASAEDRRQFRREAEIAAQVHHPNLIAVYDWVDDGWLVMEHMAADSLDKILANGPLPPERVARIGMQIAGALAALHAHGIVHRDVKPGNILVGDNDLAKLTDFGISTWSEVTGGNDGRISGTPAYTAPEVAAGNAADRESDVFSLGATLYAAVEGAPPFGTGEPAEILTRARAAEIPPPRHAGPLTEPMTDALHRKPGKRPTADRLRERLREITGDWEPLVPAPAPRSWWRRRPVQVAASALVVVAVAVPLVPRLTGADLIGEERTAEPCALLQADDFREFGAPELKPNWGNFNRCDVLIDVKRDKKIDVELQLATMVSQRRDAFWRTIAAPPFEVLEIPPSGPECNRLIIVDDRYGVRVSTEMDNSPADLCRIADIAVERARTVLRAGQIPRRAKEFPPKSAARINACELLPADALPGLNGGVNVFGGWSCKWRSEVTASDVHVRYDQHAVRSPTKGTLKPVGGHEAYVEKKAKECIYRVPYPPSIRPELALVDHLLVSVTNDRPEQERCAAAEQLTKAAADNMNRGVGRGPG
ncbi:hypothetical protein Lesp02_31140 [Lentzea sp. NBRC 105346]|uniref:serine/threonine-protein kinase n=1 Tax=Lentzea sp. NBRC 105346 TaxID=3032205 RepID=UPI0024A22F09|nr:serine/threonine-protein kinase [Lentzea sp. NBRC 105346]GLZ30925.1 hypothetical protein Lesp02_31140 [Lentzea sp. NBRC 105346]